MTNENRGLATSYEETKKGVAREGESAPHNERGLESADEENREKVASRWKSISWRWQKNLI